MPDIPVNGELRIEDVTRCSVCGNQTYLVFDEGYGFTEYKCAQCGLSFQFQFDFDGEFEMEGLDPC